MKKVAVMIGSYNDKVRVLKALGSVLKQDYKNIEIVVVDDGSFDGTVESIGNLSRLYKNIHLVALKHLERGIGRNKGIEEALKYDPEYLFVMDGDMKMNEGLITSMVNYIEKSTDVGALVIPEKPHSYHRNFFTKVKIFEREVINNDGSSYGKNSIEAARFWKIDEFLKTGGFNPDQIAFEEIQPSIRYLEKGGKIKRLRSNYVYHDEKKVTFTDIIRKKKYYFKKMETTINTEEDGFLKALKRWYFFRPVLYRPTNLLKYLRHPILFVGMITMYLSLTAVYVKSMVSANQ